VVARVRAVLRRTGPFATSETIRAGSVQIDTATRRVTRSGEAIDLTAKEFELLVLLARHPNRVFRRDELTQAIWGWSYGDSSTVTVHVRRLREKIESDPSHPRSIETVWGVGYLFRP
jgi:two-component system response regulator ResD